MTTGRKRATTSLTMKAAELAFAVPQVVTHRLTRVALSGPQPSARDGKEFQRMIAEKNVAFGESWSAMARQAALAHQALAGSIFKSLLSGRLPSAATSAARFHRDALSVLGKGVAPVHRKAVANAKRLGRTKLR